VDMAPEHIPEPPPLDADNFPSLGGDPSAEPGASTAMAAPLLQQQQVSSEAGGEWT
jgi:hypothetical protein